MKTKSAASGIVSLLAVMLFSACVDGDVTRRDDGYYPSGIRAGRVEGRGKDLLLQDPKLTPKEAAEQSYDSTAANSAAAEAEYLKRRKQSQERQEFLDDLAAAGK